MRGGGVCARGGLRIRIDPASGVSGAEEERDGQVEGLRLVGGEQTPVRAKHAGSGESVAEAGQQAGEIARPVGGQAHEQQGGEVRLPALVEQGVKTPDVDRARQFGLLLAIARLRAP